MNALGEHRAELVRGLLSAGLLACLLIGIPILLTTGVGWPLPREFPSSSEVLAAVKAGAVSSSFVLKALSLALWILWFQMLAGMAVELWAHSHGRVVPRVVFIPQFMQRLSARIMGTALVIAFSLQHPSVAVADNQELLAPTTIEMDIDVEQRDSQRMLAERYLGDANRWSEVFILNQGHAQASGESLSDPARLQPGWELVMPAGARPSNAAESDENTTPGPQPGTEHRPTTTDQDAVVVQSGDTLWGLAAHHLQDPKQWVDIFHVNRDTIQDPGLIVPGWQLQLPANGVNDDALSLSSPRAEPTDWVAPVMAYASSTPTVVAPVAPPSSPGSSSSSVQTMFTIGGLGIFASSLTWMLARFRRTQRRGLPHDRRPASLSGEALRLEEQLHRASDPDRAIFLDAALRVMASRVAVSAPPQIIGASLSPRALSIFLDAPCTAPMGFTASPDNLTWELSRTSEIEQLLTEADGVPAPLPTLVAVGKAGDDEFFLNLERLPALRLEGNPDAVDGLCAAMATQLASSHLADDLTVVCVGFGQDLSVFERVEHAPDMATASELIVRLQRQNRALLGNHPPSVETRIGNCDDYWHPIVVLVPGRLTSEEASQLFEVCGTSVCVAAHGLDGATWSARFEEDDLWLEPIGLRLEPHGLSRPTVAAIGELTAAAQDIQGVAMAVEPVMPPREPESALPVPLAGPVDIEVQVMGTVDILGVEVPLTSRRALDLVAYLAFHPEGATRDQLKAHVWPPDEPPTESTLSNTVSRARKALGNNDDGEPYLPRVSTEGIYRLRPEVGTDVGRFETLLSAARDSTGEEGLHKLLAAFELVRGTPFTSGTGDLYRWADFGLRTQIECLVDTAAHELAERCLSAGDLDGARRTAVTSLRLVGVCEQCYRWRMLAAADNPTEVRQIMSELVNLLERENGSTSADDLISADLLELYDQLISTRTAFS